MKEAIIKAEIVTEEQIPEIQLETPRDKANGDFATNIAMQLTKLAKKNPRQVAEAIIANIDMAGTMMEKIDIAGPGFMNITVRKDYLQDVVKAVLTEAENYGRSTAGTGEKIQVEFVSANPTGDLHLGHARGASVGDSLCNVLDFAGYDVAREYYINDAGNQIHNLAISIEARYLQALGLEKEMPEDGYHGKDIIDIAADLVKEHGDKFVSMSDEDRYKEFRAHGLKIELAKLQKDLADFRVGFDNWFSETSLYENGKIDSCFRKITCKWSYL